MCYLSKFFQVDVIFSIVADCFRINVVQNCEFLEIHANVWKIGWWNPLQEFFFFVNVELMCAMSFLCKAVCFFVAVVYDKRT